MRFAPAFAPPAPATGAKPDTASAEISTDVSYLPDLTAYLDDLLRTRERLAAAIDGVDEWARADATPAEEEITRIRRLISRIKGDMTQLTDTERAAGGQGRRRGPPPRSDCSPVSLGMPSFRAPHPRRKGGPRMSTRPAIADGPLARPVNPRTGAMSKGRQADSARRRQRVIAALTAAVTTAAEISVAGIARAAAVDRAFLYRHRDLLAKIHALEAAPPVPSPAPGRASPGHPCRPTCSPPRNAQPGSTAESGSSRNACPKPSASRPGANPDLARPPTSTPSARRSPISNSRP